MKRLAVIALMVAACTAAPADSGVQGFVKSGPTCPVQIEASPCPDRPLSTDLLFLQGTEEVARARSASDGSFRIALAPGDYTIEGPPGGPPSLKPVAVSVKAHAFVTVTLTFDTGIR
ncbi:MAG: hypothetical protein ABR552_05980 [Actinomycetota bacterium]|nr:carboxypeptidase-like regulatory domain-containing protein [Actinomycetota bacterium]